MTILKAKKIEIINIYIHLSKIILSLLFLTFLTHLCFRVKLKIKHSGFNFSENRYRLPKQSNN